MARNLVEMLAKLKLLKLRGPETNDRTKPLYHHERDRVRAAYISSNGIEIVLITKLSVKSRIEFA